MANSATVAIKVNAKIHAVTTRVKMTSLKDAHLSQMQNAVPLKVHVVIVSFVISKSRERFVCTRPSVSLVSHVTVQVPSVKAIPTNFLGKILQVVTREHKFASMG